MIRQRVMYRGLRDGEEVIGWNTNRDRVYSLLRRTIPKALPGQLCLPKFTIEKRTFIEKKGGAA